MKKNWLLAGSLALVLVMVGLVACSPGNTLTGEIKGININSQQEGIWVNGTGKVSVQPDIATLQLGIEAQETTVAVAQSKAAEAMKRVMDVLTASGVADEDIQTQQLSIQKVTRWDQDKQQEIVIGYRVANIVTAKIRKIDEAGKVIDAVAEAGGDLTRIDNIAFSVDDPTGYAKEARGKAMADAKAKAEQLAELGDITLGKPTYISESSYIPGPIYRQDLVGREVSAPAVETPISPGEIDITVSVQVTYAIMD